MPALPRSIVSKSSSFYILAFVKLFFITAIESAIFGGCPTGSKLEVSVNKIKLLFFNSISLLRNLVKLWNYIEKQHKPYRSA